MVEAKGSCIQVFVRVRPLSTDEISRGSSLQVSNDGKSLKVLSMSFEMVLHLSQSLLLFLTRAKEN